MKHSIHRIHGDQHISIFTYIDLNNIRYYSITFLLNE